jgi:hypothetical protein
MTITSSIEVVLSTTYSCEAFCFFAAVGCCGLPPSPRLVVGWLFFWFFCFTLTRLAVPHAVLFYFYYLIRSKGTCDEGMG